jgi:hypothetical protein
MVFDATLRDNLCELDMRNPLNLVANLFLWAIFVLTLAALLFPKLYETARRHLRLGGSFSDAAVPDRERQLAMVIILLIAGGTLVQLAFCGR